MSICEQKIFLRHSYKEKLQKLTPVIKKNKQAALLKQLHKLDFLKKSKIIASYKACKYEVCLQALHDLYPKKFCYPVVQDELLHFYTNSNVWSTSSLSILEPADNLQNKQALKNISVYLIPGLAFDHRGARLGRGKAYYDKTLKLASKSLFVGIAFTEQIHKEDLPISQHDILLDMIVTDQFVLIPLKSQLKKHHFFINKPQKQGLAL